LGGKEIWQQYSQQIQQRVIQPEIFQLKDIKNSKLLHKSILKFLTQAHDDGILETKPHELRQLLKITPKSKGKIELTGGVRNFKRRRELPHFSRNDGCWFDFSIMINEDLKPVEVIGFDFEIRFPDAIPVKYIRYDLNLPGHDNETNGLRFHIHPGCDDFMIHSPPMSPIEILHLFLYDFRIPDRPRKN
jgi:hypothetical protein